MSGTAIQHTGRIGHERSDTKPKRSPSYDDLFLWRRREGDSNPRFRFPRTRHFQCRTIGRSVISPVSGQATTSAVPSRGSRK